MNRVFPHSISIPALACALGLSLNACMDEAGPGARPDTVDRELPRLFAPSPAGLEPAKAYPEEIRARLNALDPALLSDGGAALAGASRFELNLFDDAAFTAEVDRAEAAGPGRFTLNGHLAGADGSYFILTYSEGMVAVTAYDPERGYYEMEPAGAGLVKVSEFSPGKLPRITHAMIMPDGMPMDHGSMDMPPAAPKAAAGPAVIDIMVVYTAAAAAGAGGEAAMRARIDKAVAEGNTAFLNSQVNAKLNLVHAEQVTYAESGNLSTDLGRLQGKTDGHMDGVHALRETYKADLVSLVVENTSAGVAGIGYVMTSASSYFKAYAFTAIARQYTGAYNTLAHEVGHNLGCAHDRQNSTSQAAYPYSYGYRFFANGVQYRTIMAYSPGQGLPYYSNPNVLYLGVPMGIPDGQPNPADNARTLNNTTPTAMNFYAGTATPPPAQKAALLVIGNASALGAGDQAAYARLQTLGFAVTAKSGLAATAADAAGMGLILISSTVTSGDVNTKFRAATVPVVNWEQALQDDFGMVDLASTSEGLASGQTQLQMTGSAHPVAAGLTGLQMVATTAGDFAWGKPNAAAAAIATQAGDGTRVPVYANEKGAAMPGLAAPARRVQVFLTDATGASLTAAGWALFDNAVKWAAGP